MARNLLGVKRKDLKMCKKNFSLKHLIKNIYQWAQVLRPWT